MYTNFRTLLVPHHHEVPPELEIKKSFPVSSQPARPTVYDNVRGTALDGVSVLDNTVVVKNVVAIHITSVGPAERLVSETTLTLACSPRQDPKRSRNQPLDLICIGCCGMMSCHGRHNSNSECQRVSTVCARWQGAEGDTFGDEHVTTKEGRVQPLPKMTYRHNSAHFACGEFRNR